MTDSCLYFVAPKGVQIIDSQGNVREASSPIFELPAGEWSSFVRGDTFVLCSPEHGTYTLDNENNWVKMEISE